MSNPECELSNDNTKLDGENSHKASPYAKSYRKLKKVERWRDSLPQGKTHQLLLIPNGQSRNHSYSNMAQTVQSALKNIYVYTYMDPITIN